MLDLKLIESDLETVKVNLGKRGFDTSVLETILNYNNKRKELLSTIEGTRQEINRLSREVGTKKKAGENADDEMQQVHALKVNIEADNIALESVEKHIHDELSAIPNLIDEEVPVGKDEDSNQLISTWGEPKKFDFEAKDHVALGEDLKMLDFETAAKLTGSRFVVYKKDLAKLERAIANFMLDFLGDRGYDETIPPFIVKDTTLYGTGQLPKFSEDLFKLEGDQEWYLIPTAEVPVTNIHAGEILNSKDLPIKYSAHTPCFRSEAGSYGRDTRGLIRMHQFSKVEMVQITTAEQSEAAFEEMVNNASGVLEALELPYKKVLLCTGDIGFGARKTIDLEVWVPSQNKYREISSVSNCWDFQARRAKVRYKENGQGKAMFTHTLNGSCLAVGRTLVAIMENYQRADGSIDVPEALRPYFKKEVISV